jgi:alpha-tubulin suppressor-like RCC1 family protein
VAIGITKISCGSRHSVGINEYGRAYGWGDSSQGQLGISDKEANLYPTPTSLDQWDINDISAAGNITLFLKSHKVSGCGSNHLGQLGLGHKHPVKATK